jgi:hypothetical protein
MLFSWLRERVRRRTAARRWHASCLRLRLTCRPRLELLEERRVPTSFASTGNFATGLNPLFEVAGDFNGDHNPDLAVVNGTSGTVSILLNDGHGAFGPAAPLVTGGLSPAAAVVGDFNGDGKLDLAVTNNGSNSVTVFLGNGDGTFTLGGTGNFGAALNGPIGIAAGRFTASGKLDLAVTNSAGGAGNTVSILIGNGDGTFHAGPTLTVGTDPHDVAVADLNKDGKADLIVANRGGNSVTVLLGDGNGGFVNSQTVPVGQGPVRVGVADFNGDGVPDVAVSDSGDNTVGILLNTGGGTLDTPIFTAVGSGPQGLAIADFNHDGKADLVVADSVGNAFGVLLGSGNGTFQPVQLFQTGTTPVSVVATDLNGDCFPDVAVVNNGDNDATVFLNTSIQFAVPAVYGVGGQPQGIAAGDFNGDGIADLAIANKADNSVSILLGNRDGTFRAAGTYLVGTAPMGVIVGDFNGDGKLDIAVADSGSNAVSVLLANGDGTFQAAINSGTEAQPVAVAAGDFNRDGFTDLAVVNRLSGTLDILLNNGNGTFRIVNSYSAGTGVTAVATGVLTASGNVDVVTASAGNTSNVRVFVGNGDGSMQNPTVLSADAGPSSVAIGDLNRDGFADVVVANAQAGDVTVFLNKGSAVFQPGVNYAAGAQPQAVAIGDFHHDHRPDIAVANAGGNAVSLLRGNGDGTFQALIAYPAGPSPTGLVVSSFAGGPDIAVTDAAGNNVSTLINNFPGEMVTGADAGGGPHVRLFNAKTGAVLREFMAYSPQFTGGVRVALGDVRADGVEDIVTAPGPGGGPDIRVFDACTGALLREFMAYAPQFTGGVYLAVADVNGDGYADIITGADAGGGPHVEVWSGKDGSLLRSFYAYMPTFTGGVRVAAGDVNGDGKAEVVTAPGRGGGPDVRVWDGGSGNLIREFAAYDPGYRFGVFVAVGDVNRDGFADIITGTDQGSSAGANVRVFSGLNGAVLQNFFAYPPSFDGGVRVGVVQDINDDGGVDIVAAAGPSGGPHVEVFDGLNPGAGALDSLFAYSAIFAGGVFVGAA